MGIKWGKGLHRRVILTKFQDLCMPFWLQRATLGSKSSHQGPKVFMILHFMVKGHPTMPGVQISSFGYRLFENGDKAPRG